MKNLSSWLIVMFMGAFWVFRIIVAYETQYTAAASFAGFIAFNETIEIILLFVTILCIILFLRRNILGGIIYLIGYGSYFGSYFISTVFPEFISGSAMSMSTMENGLVALIGIILAIGALLDLLWGSVHKTDPRDKKTDWYFKDEKYDRDLDERADKNQYRNY